MARFRVLRLLVLAGLLAPAVARAETAPISVFGQIQGPSTEQAKKQTMDWLRAHKADAARLAQAESLWSSDSDRAILDRVAESFMLVCGDARRAVETARDRVGNVPGELPKTLFDEKCDVFFRANLSLYYAKQLAERRGHEEALVALKAYKAEQTVDPASYWFFRAVCENKLLLKKDASESIDTLLNKVANVPERYQVVAMLMKLDMQSWKDGDLAYIARRMEEIEGRLENARGGKKTQEKQKEVIDLLAKMIEELEKQCGT
jgi:hypothetical protein